MKPLKIKKKRGGYLQTVGVRGGLKTALELENHTRVKLDSDDHLASFQKLFGEITSAGTNLKNDIGALDAGFLDDALHKQRVLQNVLPL